ncbi:MAG: GTPase ObgE [Anaerovorax sp.]
MFVDRAKISIKSGKGGDGAVSFRREPFVPEGGPDGGDGGRGGDVIFIADSNLRTLMDFRFKTKYEAQPGGNGMKKKCFGKQGENLVLKVPPGTIVIDDETGLVMKDLIHSGDKFIAARGGKGGKGNVNFKNSIRQAPNFAESGGFSQGRVVRLELKLIADVGLIGFPNVGKSTFLSVSTSANPKIANYHFTTVTPNLGVVEIYDTSFVMADIPGLIEGAHQGAGLGLDFLKHIERTKVLIHIIDASGSEGRDPVSDFDLINNELGSYGEKLLKKPQLVVANKMDMVDEESESYQHFKTYVEEKGYAFFPMSAPLHQGVKEILSAAVVELEKLAFLPVEEEVYELFHLEQAEEAPDYREIYPSKDGRVFVLKGKQLTKIFNSTNFNDMGSLRYLYKYIEKNGAIKKLKQMGLEEGDTIRIVNFEFEYANEDEDEE